MMWFRLCSDAAPPKVAVTEEAPAMVMEHAAVPEQAPLQPVKVLLAAGVSLSVT